MPSGPRDTKDLAAASLASGSTIEVAANLAGVSTTTIFRWKREDPEFSRRISELRAAAVASALGLLSESMAAAATALTVLVKHRSAEMRFKSAVKIIELGLKLSDSLDIAERVASLEELMLGGTNGGALDEPTEGNRGEGGGEDGTAASG